MAEIPIAAVVLDYAPPAERPAHVRWAINILWLIGVALIGAVVGSIVHPVSFVAVGYMQVDPGSQANFKAIEQSKREQVALLLSDNTLVEASKSLAGTPTPLTAAELKSGLHVQAVPESKLISVHFEHANSQLAAAGASAIMRVPGSGIRMVAAPFVPTQQRFLKLYLIGGAVSALLIYGVFLAIRHKCRAAKAAL
jgi:hypothetical protein